MICENRLLDCEKAILVLRLLVFCGVFPIDLVNASSGFDVKNSQVEVISEKKYFRIASNFIYFIVTTHSQYK
uniref:Uncharacterized protein n=1 Tax=Pararge aegeria TaxID=116150 RepID=S4P2R3_9NEOP